MPHLTAERRDTLDWLTQLAYTTWRLFKKNGLPNHAAATAFYFLLSATPLLLLLMYATQWLAQLAEDYNYATILLAALYDQFHLGALTEMGFIPQSTQLAVGGVGGLTLLLSSRGLVKSVYGAIQVVFPEDSKRKLVTSWILPLIIIPITFLLVILAGLSQGALRYLGEARFLGGATTGLLSALNLLLVLAVGWGLIFAAYWRLPLRPPPVRSTALVALLATLSLAILFGGFGLFFQVDKYRAVYGALGGVVFVLIAAYFACFAFYLWAQFLYTLGKVDVAALERLFLGGGEGGANRLEGYVFGRAGRLLSRYGQTFAAGETLIREGDDSRTAFYLYSGRVGLFKEIGGVEKRLGQLEEGQLFGEMAYLLNEKRTATVTAETEVVALTLPPEMLEELMRYSAPLSRRIIGTLCQRLQRMNQAIQG